MPKEENNKGIVKRADYESTTRKAGKNYMLVIGIDDYAHCPTLYNAVKDAQDIVEVLQDRFRFNGENITTLYNEKATKRNIYNAFRSFRRKITPQDNFLVYFSGHGEFDKDFGLGYWIPVNAELGAVDAYIPNSEIRNIFSAIESHHTFLMVDSCFSGALFAKGANRDISLRKERDPSRWGLTAGRNEIVTDGEPGKNSPFAESILYQLKTATQPIGVAELCDKVLEVVSANANQTPRGEPLKVEGHKGGQFVFHLKMDEVADLNTEKTKIKLIPKPATPLQQESSFFKKCIGRKDKSNRCNKEVKYFLFCDEHRFQWMAIIIPTLTVIGLLGGIYQDVWKPFFMENEEKSKITIIDTSIEGNLPYTENNNPSSSSSLEVSNIVKKDSIINGTKVFKSVTAKKRKNNSLNKDVTLNIGTNLPKHDFPEVTFTLRNEGNMEAYFDEFEIELSNFKLDASPDLKLKSHYCSDSKNPQIFFYIHNNGWGSAKNLQINDIGYFNDYVDWDKKSHLNIESGDKKLVFEVPIFKNRNNKNKDNFDVELTYTGLGKSKSLSDNVSIEKRCCDCPGVKIDSDATYISLFEFPAGADSDLVQKKSYRIKRKIPAKGHDVFAIKLGVDKSCSVMAKFNFMVDKKVTTAESIKLIIWNPMESALNKKYNDGEVF